LHSIGLNEYEVSLILIWSSGIQFSNKFKWNLFHEWTLIRLLAITNKVCNSYQTNEFINSDWDSVVVQVVIIVIYELMMRERLTLFSIHLFSDSRFSDAFVISKSRFVSLSQTINITSLLKTSRKVISISYFKDSEYCETFFLSFIESIDQISSQLSLLQNTIYWSNN
jgi:hypothetical protein